MLNFLKNSLRPKRIYLDYASVTPIDPRVVKHVAQVSLAFPANPSSLYREGVEAEKALAEARAAVAKHLDAHSDEIVFTSGGTESNNLAIKGVIDAAVASGVSIPHVVASEIEHPSVRELLFRLRALGLCDVTLVPINENGLVDLKELKKALRPETVLVSVMYVNNEIGTIQPIGEVAKIVRHYKKELGRSGSGGINALASTSAYPYIHTDACQAALFCPLRVASLGVDLLTLDGSKIYGPRSTGILYIKRGIKLKAQQIGGDQEFERRAGTENVAAASGFAFALDLAKAERESETRRLAALRSYMIDGIRAGLDGINGLGNATAKNSSTGYAGTVSVNGSLDPEKRVPNNLNICMPGMDAEYAVLRLDVLGVCVSSVTSCRSKKEDSSSYVVEALQAAARSVLHKNFTKNLDNIQQGHDMVAGGDEGAGSAAAGGSADCSKSSLRITFGRFTTKKDVKRATNKIISTLTRML